MARSAVVIVEQGRVALIQRVRGEQTYYLFPGGGVEEGETPEEAAIREAYEELGLVVELDQLLAKVHFNSNDQYYFLAHTVRGEFGTGAGEEMTSESTSAAGSYTPTWLTLDELARHDVRPRELCELLTSAGAQDT